MVFHDYETGDVQKLPNRRYCAGFGCAVLERGPDHNPAARSAECIRSADYLYREEYVFLYMVLYLYIYKYINICIYFCIRMNMCVYYI